MTRLVCSLVGLWTLVGCPWGAAFAQEPLHRQIDALLAQSQTGPVAPLASDAEFLRRVSLDLVGTLPTPEETRAFLSDADPQKRAQVVDRLLADPRHSLHLAEWLDATLMERRAARNVPHADWLKYLQESCRENKPWNQFLKEMVSSDGTDPATRPAARFFLDRDAEPHIMTRDIGRIFFGVDLQCAQCHDHPLVDHYAQSDYYGLFAFVNRTVMFNDATAKLSYLGELAEGNADYQSVFTQDASRSRPRLPGGEELNEPHFALGDEYVVAPADKVRPVAKHSRRALLAQAAEGTNAAFNRNLPNRLWAQFFGRGLVHPVDWHHPHNPAANPELMDLLAQQFATSGFNIRELIRQLVLTEAYQRSLDPAADLTSRLASAAEKLPALEAQVQELEAATKAAAEKQTELYNQMLAAGNALKETDQAYTAAVKAAVALKKPITDAEAAVAKTAPQVEEQQKLIAALSEAVAKGAEVGKLLADDAEVKQAGETFQKKLDAANTKLATLQKTLADQTAAVAAAKEKWQAGVAASETAYAAYVTAAEPWEQLKPQWKAARDVTLQTAARLEFQRRQMQRWQASATWQQSLQQLAAAEQAVPVAETAWKTAGVRLTEQQSVVTAALAAQTQAAQGLQLATQQLDTAKGDVETKQGLAKPVFDAIAATEIALQKLAGDAELSEVLAKLKSRYERLDAAVKEAASVVTARAGEQQQAAEKLKAAEVQHQAATAELGAREKLVATAAATLAQARENLDAARTQVEVARETALRGWEQEFVSRVEAPLSPEQFANAMMTATGMAAVQMGVTEQELEKTIPAASVADDPAKQAERNWKREQLQRERLRGHVNAFINLYAAGAGQPQDQFFATADQALYIANGTNVLGWLNPSGTNLAVRLQKLEDPSEFADELYISVLCRLPSPDEKQQVTSYLSGRTEDRLVAIKELIWALLTSAEFRFNL